MVDTKILGKDTGYISPVKVKTSPCLDDIAPIIFCDAKVANVKENS